MTHVNLYSDGAARGNPGPGGYGVVLTFTDAQGQLHTKELSQGYICTTNNRMELLGVIRGLEALKHACEVDVYSDSKYVVDAFNQHWVEGWLKRGWKNAKKEPVKNTDSLDASSRSDEAPHDRFPLGERTCGASRERTLR